MQEVSGSKIAIWRARCPIEGCGEPVGRLEASDGPRPDRVWCLNDHQCEVEWIPSAAGAYEPVLHFRCARDSDWCDGRICVEHGIDCPRADPA